MENEIKTVSLKFIEQVKKKVNLTKFDKDEWFKGIYSTIQRTKKGGLATDKKEKLKDLIFNTIVNLKSLISSQQDYDNWFNELTSNIEKDISLTFGQSQKIVNILMKYHFCYYYSDLDKTWKGEYAWLSPFFDFLHVPIDNILMYNLKQKFGNERIIKIIKAWEYRDKNNHVTYNGVFLVGEEQVRWSKLTGENKDKYDAVQSFMRDKIKGNKGYRNILHFEMKELWV